VTSVDVGVRLKPRHARPMAEPLRPGRAIHSHSPSAASSPKKPTATSCRFKPYVTSSRHDLVPVYSNDGRCPP
jgi:hypothetical protein